jgi:hypothetical protein
MRWVGLVVGLEKYIQNFGLKAEEKRLFGRHRHRWEGNIEMDLMEIGLEDVDWIHVAQGRNR